MKNKTIKVKALEGKEDLVKLAEGDVVIISVGSGRLNDMGEYHGCAIFIGKANDGLNFCRPHANANSESVGYHIYKKDASITATGTISARNFFTYGYYSKLIKNSRLM